MFDREHPSADRAFSKVHLLSGSPPDIIANDRFVCLELIECMVQHLTRLFDHILTGPGTFLNLLHMLLKSLGHIGPCDRVRMLLQRFGNHHADKRGSQGISFDIFP
jgi:hypothetical protein